MNNYLPILILFIIAVGFAVTNVGISAVLGRRKPTAEKLTPYECGIEPVGSARERFSVKFYLIAMLFVIFDIEVVFLYPWAVVFKPLKKHLLSKSILSCFLHLNRATQEDHHRNTKKLSPTFSGEHPLRILVAEDNATNQKLAQKVLGKLGYTSDIAKHGKEVLEMVSNKNYDIILMDVQMPEMDGLEASRMIRMCLSIQPVIIAMTANTLQGDREACLQAGMDDYISKPIRLEELVDVLEKWAINIHEKE